MKLRHILSGLILALCAMQAVAAPRVIGYYPYWAQYAQFSPKDLRLSLVTGIHYGYAVPNAGELALADESDQANFEELTKLCDAQKVSIVLSIGGPGAEDALRETASSDDKLVAFSKSIVSWMNKYNLSGVEIDWQNPTADDMDGLEKLVAAARSGMDDEFEGAELSVALYAKGNEGAYRSSKLEQASYFTVFALDNMNADIATVQPDAGGKGISAVVDGFASKGFNKSKLVAVLPLYGKSFNGATGLGSSHQGTGSGNEGLLSYKELMEKFDGDAYKVSFDEASQSEVAVSGTEAIVFMGIPSFEAVAEYASENKTGGVALYDVTLDRREGIISLLATVNLVLRPQVKIPKK